MVAKNNTWERAYRQGQQLNAYPHDLLVSIIARKYFDVPWSLRHKIRILDLGCGAGCNAKFLAENGFDIYGIDGAATAIKICRKKFKTHALSGHFICGDIIDLPYQDNFFDVIIDRESMYANKLSDIKRIIQGVYQKLRSKGIFISFMNNEFVPDKTLIKNMGTAHLVSKKEVLELFSQFKVQNIMRHSLREVRDTSNVFMSFDEYVVIAKKTLIKT